MAELQEEGLIVPDEITGKPVVGQTGGQAVKTPFVRPVLQKFTDMQDILLLDPIHEANDMGWPYTGTQQIDEKGKNNS